MKMVSRNVRTPHTNCEDNLQKFLAFSLYELFFKILDLQPDLQSKDFFKKKQDPSSKKTTHVIPPGEHS